MPFGVCLRHAGGREGFGAVVGLDDETKNDERASVTFEVYGDVKEMESPELLAGVAGALYENDPLAGRSMWTSPSATGRCLVVTDAGDGIAADHADWVDAGFFTS
ncbi:MAG: NPCBM/NEW2 domain-containing protein [Kiritimatiellia bacterium]